MGDVCQSFGSISLLPNQFSWWGVWQCSFCHLLAKILIDTVLCWVTWALVPVSPKQQKFLSGAQMHHWKNLKHFLSPLKTPKQLLFLVKKWIAAKPAGEWGSIIKEPGGSGVLGGGKLEGMNLVLGVHPHLGKKAALAQIYSSPSLALLGIKGRAHLCRLSLPGSLDSS